MTGNIFGVDKENFWVFNTIYFWMDLNTFDVYLCYISWRMISVKGGSESSSKFSSYYTGWVSQVLNLDVCLGLGIPWTLWIQRDAGVDCVLLADLGYCIFTLISILLYWCCTWSYIATCFEAWYPDLHCFWKLRMFRKRLSSYLKFLVMSLYLLNFF